MLSLIYIGKSNKKFTHNRVYTYWGNPSLYLDGFNWLLVFSNKSRIQFTPEHVEYFQQNFIILDEQEFLMFNRKIKLNKISKN